MRERTVPKGTAGSWSLPGAARRSPAPRSRPAGLFLVVALVAGLAAATPGTAGADESDTAAVAPRALSPKVVQQAYLKASNTGGDDRFGSAVAISGDTMVIGAPSEDSAAMGVNPAPGQDTAAESGAAYVFVRKGTTWRQQAYLKASNTGSGDGFGSSVAISGDTIVVGAPGEDSRAKSVNGNQADDTAEGAGAAYVFTRSGTTWRQQAYLKASNTGKDDLFGSAVAISGATIVVGAMLEDSRAKGINRSQSDDTAENAGAAYIFFRSGTTWRQQAYLKASNTGKGDLFGWSVAISGSTIVVGAPIEGSKARGVNGDQADNTAAISGAAYVFTRSGTTWRQQSYLKASNTDGGDQFGWSVATSGSTIAVGAPGEDSKAQGVNGGQADNTAEGAGAAYVFTRSGTTWRQQAYLKASNTGKDDVFGSAVAISGATIVAGAPLEDSASGGVNGDEANDDAPRSGAAYGFTRGGTTWRQLAYLKASNPGGGDPIINVGGDDFGSWIAVSGTTIVSGAPFEDSAAPGVNDDEANDDAPDAGAAYAFVIDGTPPRVTAPVARVRTGIALPAQGGLPVRWAWTGSDPGGSGVDRHEFESRPPGGAWIRIGDPVEVPRLDLEITPGAPGQERVRAIDRAGNRSAWAIGPVFTARLVEQTATAVTFKGAWKTDIDAFIYSGGSTRFTDRAGASATSTFSGRSIALVSSVGPGRGRYRVFVDGRLNRTVDLVADTFLTRMIVWQKTWKTRGRHTVKVVVEGTGGRPFVDLDALVVLK